MSLYHLTLTIAKTVYFDRPLPKDVSTARERNKLVYDVAFKSLCLDWSKRHAISSSSKQHASTPEWDYNNDENLQYNHWTFGDLNLLIRNQSDGDVFNVRTLPPFTKISIFVLYSIHHPRLQIKKPV